MLDSRSLWLVELARLSLISYIEVEICVLFQILKYSSCRDHHINLCNSSKTYECHHL